MIVVVEGISACGKSDWCAAHAQGHVVAENGRFDEVPDRARDPAGAARFWAERNADRWQAALAIERKRDYAVCDTDPLKLHYLWCLCQIGEAAERDWRLELAATRQTIAEGRIGFAERYLVGRIDPEIARARALADRMRRRRNFALHVRLQPGLLQWYSALAAVLPGRVHFGFPAVMPALTPQGDRYDLNAFDAMIAILAR